MVKMQISITIDDHMLGKLDVVAKLEKRNRSNMVQKMISDYLKNKEDNKE